MILSDVLNVNKISIDFNDLPIIISFETREGTIKEYVLKTNCGKVNPQSVLFLHKKE